MELAGKRITVMGLGRFGGGVGVARYLVKQGADVLVTDQFDADQLRDSLAELEGLPIDYRLGEHNISDFTTCDMVVANPAVKPDNRFLRAAHAADIPVSSEIRLLVEALPNRKRTIGVTGTAGKSTVTAMIGHVLGKAERLQQRKALKQENRKAENQDVPKVWVGGNLGGSLLDHIDKIGPDDWVVLELSSFMLHGLRADNHHRGWSPHIAVITNISPNHLDWHGTHEAYTADKRTIFAYQDQEDKLILTAAARAALGGQEPANSVLVPDSPVAELLIPGEHNRVNARCALMVCAGTGVMEGDAHCLADFPGLPHRLQFVLEHQAVRFFNDSKCTTPEAAELAIDSFDPGTVHIILGGYDKGSDLKPLAGLAAQRCAGVYTIGDTGDTICTAAEAASGIATVVACGDMETAVREAAGRAQPGQVVLLSPACASWDQFDHYEQRGERFIDLVKGLKA